MLEHPPEIHRVPGEWRCIQCGERLSTALDVIDRPECPKGCEKRMVALTWKRYGPEQEEKRAALVRETAQARDELRKGYDRLSLLLKAMGAYLGLSHLVFFVWLFWPK